jgi:hypothetical protein
VREVAVLSALLATFYLPALKPVCVATWQVLLVLLTGCFGSIATTGFGVLGHTD